MTKVRHVLLGPPGTGKTEALLTGLTDALTKGTTSERVAFVSFSRRAVREARERAGLVIAGTFPHFRTLHSMAYRLQGLTRSEVMTPALLQEFADRIGQPCNEGDVGGRCLALVGLAKARGTTLKHEWQYGPEQDLPWSLVHQISVQYKRFKESYGVVDFDDMIVRAEGHLDVDVLFLDEAQDCSKAQWDFLRRVASHVPLAYIAGDDDQAVYHWSGADPVQLVTLAGTRRVLPQSYRLPRAIKRIADAVARRIRRRIPKAFAPRDAEGEVQWYNDLDHINLRTGEWLLLARGNHQLRALRTLCRQQGVVYTLPNGDWSFTLPSVRAALTFERLRKGKEVHRTEVMALQSFMAAPVPVSAHETQTWEMVFPTLNREDTWMESLVNMPDSDREYLRELRRNKEPLQGSGRVRIDTVHGAKGAQADNVVLLTDLTPRIARQAETDPDSELRVQYVGVTRAREALHLIQPHGRYAWAF